MTDTLQIVVVIGVSVGAIATIFRHDQRMPQRVTICVIAGTVLSYLILGAAGWL